ncbi:Collagen triple helix repeat-containing protein 1 [Lamellibrachia satsuma]|nr:Collagen triple helix repeat-containing protein 1 [Lamellibrachia satsuma]
MVISIKTLIGGVIMCRNEEDGSEGDGSKRYRKKSDGNEGEGKECDMSKEEGNDGLTSEVFNTRLRPSHGPVRGAHGQSPTCTINMPGNQCGQTPNLSVDDQFVKSSIIGLQTQIQQLMSDNVKLRQDVDGINAGTESTGNLKQCSRRGLNDNKDSGVIQTCDFFKKRTDSVLRLVWNGNMRMIQKGTKYGACRRWYFTLNGVECTEPKTIDAQFLETAKNVDSVKPAYVEGYCRGVPAGEIIVGWNVGDCPNQKDFDVGDSYTGWFQTSRIIVEELAIQNASDVIV